jgi:hypothetical protein
MWLTSKVTVNRWTIVLLALCMCNTTTADAAEEGKSRTALGTCINSLSREFEIPIQESISEGAMDYKQHEGFRFGIMNEGRAFIQYSEGKAMAIENIPFTDAHGASIRLKPLDLAIDQSDLYVRVEEGRTSFCLLAPFGGLGLSGHFQGLAALIALDVQNGVASEPVGMVVKRR